MLAESMLPEGATRDVAPVKTSSAGSKFFRLTGFLLSYVVAIAFGFGVATLFQQGSSSEDLKAESSFTYNAVKSWAPDECYPPTCNQNDKAAPYGALGYRYLYTDPNGYTKMMWCQMKNFTQGSAFGSPQFVRKLTDKDNGGCQVDPNPSKPKQVRENDKKIVLSGREKLLKVVSDDEEYTCKYDPNIKPDSDIHDKYKWCPKGTKQCLGYYDCDTCRLGTHGCRAQKELWAPLGPDGQQFCNSWCISTCPNCGRRLSENDNTSVTKLASMMLGGAKGFKGNNAVMDSLVATQQVDENPSHHPPSVQMVITLSGTWIVEPNDSSGAHYFQAGDVFFQDNVKEHPACQGDGPHIHMCGQHISRPFNGSANVIVIPLSIPPKIAGGDSNMDCPY